MKLLVKVFVGTFSRCKFIAAALTQQKTAKMEAVKNVAYFISAVMMQDFLRGLYWSKVKTSRLFLCAAAVCGL